MKTHGNFRKTHACIFRRIVCFYETLRYFTSFFGNNYVVSLKATPHKERLTALYASCLHIFRHLAQISLDGRQPACAQFVQSAEKSDGAICAQSLCGIALKIAFNLFIGQFP